jgi:hypothetical protein
MAHGREHTGRWGRQPIGACGDRMTAIVGKGAKAMSQVLGLLPSAHPLVMAKARTALLAATANPRRWEEVEQAYQVVCEHQQRLGKGS